MKRFWAGAMVFCLLAALCAPCLATGADTEGEAPDVLGAACVRVTVRAGLALQEDVAFTVSLSKSAAADDRGTDAYEQTLTLPPTGEADAVFEDLREGAYTLCITAPGFAAHRQAVEVDGWDVRYLFYTGIPEGYGLEKGTPHPGALLAGDVDGSGIIDEADAALMAQALQSPDTAAQGGALYADLDRDGAVTLLDLNLLAASMRAVDMDASPLRSVPLTRLAAQPSEGTQADGLDALLRGSGDVVLRRADGRTISEQRPVSVEFTVSHSVGAVVLEAREEDAFTEGSLLVEIVEGNARRALEIPLEGGAPEEAGVSVARSRPGALLVAWENAVRVEKATLRVTASESGTGTTLCAAAFLRDAAERLPEPAALEDGEDRSPAFITEPNAAQESDPDAETAQTVRLPRYGLINTTPAGSEGAAIVSASVRGGVMKESAVDASTGSALGTADGDGQSYYELTRWDGGGRSAVSASDGVTYEFDQAYTFGSIAVAEPVVQNIHYGYAQIGWAEGDGAETIVSAAPERRTDSAGGVWYLLRLPDPVKADRLRLCLSRAVSGGSVTIAEVGFYSYDPLGDDVRALFEDELCLSLCEGVTQEKVDALKERVSASRSGEPHPDGEALSALLETADALLRLEGSLTQPMTVHTDITAADADKGFTGLNAWQPLGVTAAAGESLVVYVGRGGRSVGEKAGLQLVATQYFGEKRGASIVAAELLVGRNEIVVPRLSANAAEAGGALYVQCTERADGADRCAVRVSSRIQTPTLDLYGVPDESERLRRAGGFIGALDVYCERQETLHEIAHMGEDAPASVNFAYEETSCILGAIDLLTDTALLSLPARQILDALGDGTQEERAQILVDSLRALDEMMALFYRYKGLSDDAENVVDQCPRGHINIRCQRVPENSLLYAAPDHIGVGIDSGVISALVTAAPLQRDEEGMPSGGFDSWPVAHAIGHALGQKAYAVPEVTGSLFAILAADRGTSESVRLSYEDVYRKVTSGESGRAREDLVQAALYWQLHLAYDDDGAYTAYNSRAEMLQSLFYARVNTYARTPSGAPKPKGVALALSGSVEQNFMRLACAAAQRDLSEFFERWGMTPNDATTAYMAQFPQETRAIWYITDDARRYRLAHSKSSLSEKGTTNAVSDASQAVLKDSSRSTVELTLACELPEEEVLGYDVTRCTFEGGSVRREPAGFTATGTFSDRLTTMNSHAVYYEVTAVDKMLHRSAVRTLPALKVSYKGYLDRTGFDVRVDGINPQDADTVTPASEQSPCAAVYTPSIRSVLDGDENTVYTGRVAADDAGITLEFNRSLTVWGVRCAVGGEDGLRRCGIYVRGEENEWIEAASGTFDAENDTIYFERDGAAAPCKTTAVRIVLPSVQSALIRVAELDVIGVSDDALDWRDAGEGAYAVRLAQAYTLPDGETTLPEGAVVFMGRFVCGTARGTIVLYDQNGKVVGGTDSDGAPLAHTAFLADESADSAGVSRGTWLYWIEPGRLSSLSGVQTVRAALIRSGASENGSGDVYVSDTLPAPVQNAYALPAETLGGEEG